jgi:two-component system OmpR family response regulator
MRVLLVEDDPMIGKVVQQALRDASYAVDWVRDGLAALVTLDVMSYDMVLLDLGLPKRDGMDVLQSIRARENDVAVVVMTARIRASSSLIANGLTR